MWVDRAEQRGLTLVSRLPPNAVRAWDWWPDLSLPGYKGLVPSPQHTGAVMLEKLSVCTATRRPPDQNGHQQRRPGSARRAEGGGRSATGERTDATLPGLGVNPGPVCSDEEAGPARATLVPSRCHLPRYRRPLLASASSPPAVCSVPGSLPGSCTVLETPWLLVHSLGHTLRVWDGSCPRAARGE